MSEPRYHINLFWPADDTCWIADVPDLRSCTAHGDTPRETLDNVRDAVDGWLAVARDRSLAIPHCGVVAGDRASPTP